MRWRSSALVNFATPPLVEDVLVAGKNGFDSEDDRPVASHRALLEQAMRRDVARRGRAW